jgi:hypothetical protein
MLRDFLVLLLVAAAFAAADGMNVVHAKRSALTKYFKTFATSEKNR